MKDLGNSPTGCWGHIFRKCIERKEAAGEDLKSRSECVHLLGISRHVEHNVVAISQGSIQVDMKQLDWTIDLCAGLFASLAYRGFAAGLSRVDSPTGEHQPWEIGLAHEKDLALLVQSHQPDADTDRPAKPNCYPDRQMPEPCMHPS